jgi:hypothetical protein
MKNFQNSGRSHPPLRIQNCVLVRGLKEFLNYHHTSPCRAGMESMFAGGREGREGREGGCVRDGKHKAKRRSEKRTRR